MSQAILTRVSPRRSRRLVAGNALLVTILLLHALDHALRQEAAVPGAVSAVGGAGLLFSLAALGLAAAAHRLDAAASVVVGFGTAVGFLAVHVAPDWGPFSQSYSDIPVDDLSWVAMFTPILAGLALGALGLLHRRGAGRFG